MKENSIFSALRQHWYLGIILNHFNQYIYHYLTDLLNPLHCLLLQLK